MAPFSAWDVKRRAEAGANLELRSRGFCPLL